MSVLAVVLAFLVGFGALRLVVASAPELLAAAALARTNYRGKALPTAGGLLVVLAVLFVEGGRIGLELLHVGDRPGLNGARPLMLFACVGFGLLGLLDDLLGAGGDQGFAGHLRALGQGRVTTGMIKLIGGAALALALASARGTDSRLRLLGDAALIALAANLGNLLDRAPGRATKVGIVAWIPLAIAAGGDAVGIALAPVIGAFVATLPDDLGERFMLGDAGANVLGAALGLAAVLELGPTARTAIVVVLAALNLASERWSFSRLIARVPVLDHLDDLGRRHPPMR